MIPLIDADILRYEIGYASEIGFRLSTGDEEAIPPWDYVEECLMGRVNEICEAVGATKPPVFYISKGESFRDQIALREEYKATRQSKKPHHFKNLTAYMEGPLQAKVAIGIEADDLIAIDHIQNQEDREGCAFDSLGMTKTIICSRDKDLRQIPGWFYSWELGKQPSFGPCEIDKVGELFLDREKKPPKLTGTGLAFFFAQCIMGDPVDNVPGLQGYGPVAAFDLLKIHSTPKDMLDEVIRVFQDCYGKQWEAELLEQGQLLWMCRRFNPDGTPELWQIGMEE